MARRLRQVRPHDHAVALRTSRLKKFGLTYDQFLKMFNDQGGKCAICPTTLLLHGKGTGRKNSACVDHDHRTGRPRALLCNRCNTAIGMFGDDPAVVDAAAGYLRKHRNV